MEIKPIKVLRSTTKAFMLEWHDFNWGGLVQAWVPKSQVKIERGTAYVNDQAYKNLKFRVK